MSDLLHWLRQPIAPYWAGLALVLLAVRLACIAARRLRTGRDVADEQLRQHREQIRAERPFAVGVAAVPRIPSRQENTHA